MLLKTVLLVAQDRHILRIVDIKYPDGDSRVEFYMIGPSALITIDGKSYLIEAIKGEYSPLHTRGEWRQWPDSCMYKCSDVAVSNWGE